MKRTHFLIIVYIIIFIIWNILFFKNTINFEIKFSSSFSLSYYFSFLSLLVGSFFWIYKWLDLRDLQEEKEKHLWYIRTINDRVWAKIDWNFFTDIKKAKKFCDREVYYILPFWFKYNISNIDFFEEEYDLKENNNNEKINKFIKMSKEEILNDEEILYHKEFIDLDKYIKNLDLHWENEFSKDSKIIVENYYERVNITNDILINLFKNWKDFVIIEWYYYVYKI